jgi:hypothetical protein
LFEIEEHRIVRAGLTAEFGYHINASRCFRSPSLISGVIDTTRVWAVFALLRLLPLGIARSYWLFNFATKSAARSMRCTLGLRLTMGL